MAQSITIRSQFETINNSDVKGDSYLKTTSKISQYGITKTMYCQGKDSSCP